MAVRPQTLLALLFVAAAGAAGGHVAAAAAGNTLCCTNTTGYHECVVACFGYYPRDQAAKICDPGCQEAYQCRTVSGDKCPTSAGDEVVQAVATTLCCSNMTGFNECVHDCFGYFPREQAEKICDPGCKEAYQCRTVSGDKCPTNSAVKGDDTVEKCMSGCKLKCPPCAANNACYRFCTKGLRAGTTTASA